ncbi:MAG: NmrA family NAD(P)-binding protein [Desulfobacterales bacterium]
MKVLVLGGTGTVGSQVLRELLEREHEVSVLTRSGDHAQNLPKNAHVVVGDLIDPKTVRFIFNNIDAVFLLNAVSPTETHEGLMAVNGAILAGVKRIVYLSVPKLENAPHLPHFGSKLPIEAAIRASRIPYTILKPNNFFQNDYLFKDAIMQHGVYPQPIGDIGLSRIDVRDIADVAAIALTTDKLEGQVINLSGTDALTGKSTADIWTRVLGRPISYGGNDLDVWEKQTLEYLPPWMTFDFKLMYAFFQEHGFKAEPKDMERQKEIQGREPMRYENFVKETSKMWEEG